LFHTDQVATCSLRKIIFFWRRPFIIAEALCDLPHPELWPKLWSTVHNDRRTGFVVDAPLSTTSVMSSGLPWQ